MSDDTYTPKAGSLAEQVVNYFRLHPTAKLTIDEIRSQFTYKGNAVLALGAALTYGLIQRADGFDGAFGAGPKLPGIVNPSAISKPNTKGGLPHGAKRGHLPALDLDALQVESGIEVPTHNMRRGESRWEPLLAKLTKVGDSMQLPREYNGTVLTYTKKRIKLRPVDTSRFKLGLDLQNVNRIWRIA